MPRRPPLFCNNISMNIPNPKLDAEALYRTLATRVKAALQHVSNVAIVCIHSGGAWLAERLAAEMQLEQRLVSVDVSFYRDDYAKKGLHAAVKPSQIPFPVDGATILLVDDVLYTGRTTRAAINELFDYGRPAKIMLAALVDRGGRELPIAADFVAGTIALSENQSLVLERAGDGSMSLTVANN